MLVQAFIKRLLQVCQLLTAPLVCASLILLSELLRTRPTLLRVSKLAQVQYVTELSCVYQPDSVMDFDCQLTVVDDESLTLHSVFRHYTVAH